MNLRNNERRLNHRSSRLGVCRNLKSVVVQIGIEDYFEDPNSPEARKLFDEMVIKLQVTAHPLLSHGGRGRGGQNAHWVVREGAEHPIPSMCLSKTFNMEVLYKRPPDPYSC